MNKWSIIGGIAAGSALGAVAGIAGVSRLRYHRSIKATLVEWRFLKMGAKKVFSEPERFWNMIETAYKVNEEPIHVPIADDSPVNVSQQDHVGLVDVVIEPDTPSKKVIVYLHGGAYIQQPAPDHWIFLERLVAETSAIAHMPLYPLAPGHTFEESYRLLTAFYDELLATTDADDIVFMGDSAGAGLAMGLCLEFARSGRELPAKLVLMSPWADLALENPDVADFEPDDCMLAIYGLREAGKLWAGDTPVDDPRLSPINGDLSILPPVTMFVSTKELFFPDVLRLQSKLEHAGVACDMHVGTGLNHVYPINPYPEADAARHIIAKIVES